MTVSLALRCHCAMMTGRDPVLLIRRPPGRLFRQICGGRSDRDDWRRDRAIQARFRSLNPFAEESKRHATNVERATQEERRLLHPLRSSKEASTRANHQM